MTRSRHHALLRILAIAASWVLVLGLPRLLVHCTDAAGSGRLEFAHEAGTCRHEANLAHPVHACCTTHGDGAPTLRTDHGCDDVSFVIELLPPERHVGAGQDPPTAIAWVTHDDTVIAAGNATGLRPPSTGPPRTDQRTALRKTTLLLL